MISLATIGVFYIPYKLVAISEVPSQLIFEGQNVYESNILGIRVKELYSTEIGITDSLEEEFLHIISKKRSKERMKILVIKRNYMNHKDLHFLTNHFNKYNIKTKFK